jgi:hypothetical protein
MIKTIVTSTTPFAKTTYIEIDITSLNLDSDKKLEPKKKVFYVLR